MSKPDDAMERILMMIGAENEKLNDFIDKTDIDEILVICDMRPEGIPDRFMKVLNEYDERYISEPEDAAEYRSNVAYTDRLRKLAHAALAHWPESTDYNIGDEHLTPTFSLSADDKDTVLKKCSEMRKIILASTIFDNPHKNRLLNRIAAIEKQVNQEKGLFDIVRSGVSDVGETLGKFVSTERSQPTTGCSTVNVAQMRSTMTRKKVRNPISHAPVITLRMIAAIKERTRIALYCPYQIMEETFQLDFRSWIGTRR